MRFPYSALRSKQFGRSIRAAVAIFGNKRKTGAASGAPSKSLLCSSSVWCRAVAPIALLALPLVLRTETPSTPTAPNSVVAGDPTPTPVDPRIARLQAFFSKLHCPVVKLAEDFVTAADDNSLDWRLLPSIAVVESGGGKAFRNNNIFGWNNGAEAFPSLRAGIHAVAFALGQSRLYQNRNLSEKLWLYNPDQDYVRTVLTVMHRISPTENLNSVSRF